MKVKRQTWPEINVYTGLFGSIEYYMKGPQTGKIWVNPTEHINLWLYMKKVFIDLKHINLYLLPTATHHG